MLHGAKPKKSPAFSSPPVEEVARRAGGGGATNATAVDTPTPFASPQGGGGGKSAIAQMLASLPDPKLPALGDEPYAMIVTGVGGTGVVTISAVLAQAAHNAGLGFGSIDMTGIAQKGGAVACHMRVAKTPEAIHAIRVGVGACDLILGGDLVVTASQKVLETVKPDATAFVYSTYELTTGDFTRKPDLTVPGAALRSLIAERARRARPEGQRREGRAGARDRLRRHDLGGPPGDRAGRSA